jgi:hypothetical protein
MPRYNHGRILPPAKFVEGQVVRVTDRTMDYAPDDFPGRRSYEMSFRLLIGLKGTIVTVTEGGMTCRHHPEYTRLYRVQLKGQEQVTVLAEYDLEVV